MADEEKTTAGTTDGGRRSEDESARRPEAADSGIAIGPTFESNAEAAAITGEEEDESSAYKVELPTFHGPLDLLLHLIKKHEVDIYDIPITLITEQYTSYLEAMEELDLDIAADYIYMAALLIHIKSQMLLPHDENAEQEIEDPRKQLVERLLQYQRFKAVAESFAELDVVRMGMWSRPQVTLPGQDASEIDMSEVGLFDLVDAFRAALRRYKDAHPQALELQRTVHKVSEKMSELYEKLKEKSPIRLQWFLEGRGRNELIAVFLGMLELVRLGGISLQQSDTFGEILISRTGNDVDQDKFALFDQT